MRHLLLLTTLALSACGGDKDDDDTVVDEDDGGGSGGSGEEALDEDGDGFDSSTDCDDADGEVYPGADELCNGVDDDCNGDIDDDALDVSAWEADADGDGFGDTSALTEACEAPDDHVASGGEADCDDTDSEVYPGAEELCNDLDDDCDGEVDEELATSTWYADADGDGYGDPEAGTDACAAPEEAVADGTDCDDSDIAVNPGAEEVCNDGVDNDCDGGAGSCGWGSTVSYTEAVASVTASSTNFALFGQSVDASGDVDGDGQVDLVMSEPRLSGGGSSGTGYLLQGPLSGELTVDVDAQATFPGTDAHTYEYTGEGMRILEDLDGDGFDEVVITAPGYDSYAGAVWLHHGPLSGTVDPDDAELTVLGDGSSLQAMMFPSAAVDLSGDGTPDLLLSTYWTGNSYKGAVYLLSGPLTGTMDADDVSFSLTGETTSDYLGRKYDTGDLDGDGVVDLVAGAQYWDNGGASASGGAFVQFGPLSGDLTDSDVDLQVQGDVSVLYLGQDPDASADLSGDGHTDLVLSAPGYGYATDGDFQGGVYVFHGPLSGGTLSPSDADVLIEGSLVDGYAGWNVDARGDFDGDGERDLVFSEGSSSSLPYAVRVFRGPLAAGSYDASSDADVSIEGSSTDSDSFGTYLHAAGDLDGQGVDDLLIVRQPNGGTDAVRLELFGGGGL